MRPAARAGDATNHPGVLGGPGVPTVLIGNLPAATIGNPHTCAFPPPAPPHPPSAVLRGSATVQIGGRPAARVGDVVGCGAVIVTGAFDVLIGD